jgi:hypothetical protein
MQAKFIYKWKNVLYPNQIGIPDSRRLRFQLDPFPQKLVYVK